MTSTEFHNTNNPVRLINGINNVKPITKLQSAEIGLILIRSIDIPLNHHRIKTVINSINNWIKYPTGKDVEQCRQAISYLCTDYVSDGQEAIAKLLINICEIITGKDTFVEDENGIKMRVTYSPLLSTIKLVEQALEMYELSMEFNDACAEIVCDSIRETINPFAEIASVAELCDVNKIINTKNKTTQQLFFE